MDKRRSPRYAINLDVVALTASGKFWVCTLHDFCLEGMLLVEKPEAIRPDISTLKDEQISIHLSIPLEG
ncbi:MAG: hypothetical protein OEZ23_02675, partial [Gammaproteobacteria bacterium]|nr:hypothetical protein [Gammaproteobacteria bacterium]